MIKAEVQIHGYRKGHQLLASSITLSKDDQATVDRLSDVAGPLRPKELFAPYISAYPLPSGAYYVVARTWQDLEVPRAGCVRTKSVLVDMQLWVNHVPLRSILQLLDSVQMPTESDAEAVEVKVENGVTLPHPSAFNASELLEALFFEEAKPIVVFDTPDVEPVAFRLLTALWPELRGRFALSTFALSPRKIGGRDFDLVFAPSNAKGKFSDWPGRRIDGRFSQSERHRWTAAIVRRVFDEANPQLLSADELKLLGGSGADSAAALRISLLWQELLEKLQKTPTAALGLLDIANSGMISGVVAAQSLEPLLAEATLKAGTSLEAKDAWDFVGAMARKMHGREMVVGWKAVEKLAAHLAEHAPDGAIDLLQQPDPTDAIRKLTPCVALGLGNADMHSSVQTLVNAPPVVFARLVSLANALANIVANTDILIRKIGDVYPKIEQEFANQLGAMLLPLLVHDRQFPAAEPFIRHLDSQSVAAEFKWQGEANDFQAKRITSALLERAREIHSLLVVRDTLVCMESSKRRDELIEQTLSPVDRDVIWLLEAANLSDSTSIPLLVKLLRRADDKQLNALVANCNLSERLVAKIPNDAVDVLVRAVLTGGLPIGIHARIVDSVILKVTKAEQVEIAETMLERCLQQRWSGDEIPFIAMLIGHLETQLDVRRLSNMALGANLTADVVNRNLIAFDAAPVPARHRILCAVDEMARALHERGRNDFDETASEAYARLLFDAETKSYRALTDAAGWLLPSLLRAKHQPVSLIIAAMFPAIYRGLSESDGTFNFFWFLPYADWSPRKAARVELVNAFMSSTWIAGDLALTACRCEDVGKILGEVRHSYRGGEYLKRIESDLNRLDNTDKVLVKRVISETRRKKT